MSRRPRDLAAWRAIDRRSAGTASGRRLALPRDIACGACLLALAACASAGTRGADMRSLVLRGAQDEDGGAEAQDPQTDDGAQEPEDLQADDAQEEIAGSDAQPDDAASSAEAPGSTGPAIHGQAQAFYRYRAVDGEADHDLMGSLLLDVGEAERDAVTAHFVGYGTFDVDGVPTGDPPAFSDITDTYDDQLTGWVYEAHLDLHSAEDLETVRVGRQDVQETPVLVTFDGLRVETRPLGEERVQVEAYGGVPAHFYESSSDGDLVFGLAGSARPWEGGRVRLDWMHLEDESLLGDHVDDLIGLELWQRVDERLLVEGRASLLEGEGRDLKLRGTYADVEQDLLLEAAWTTLFNPQNDLVQELDPFTATLLALEPYDQARIQGSKGVGEDLILAAGYDLRRLKDDEDEGQFNRDFDRVHATATWLDVLDRGLEVSLTGEIWDATDSNVNSWGADVSREWDEAFEGSLGTYYALYKLDLVAEEERENVRVYYAELEWMLAPETAFTARYELEHDSLDTYHLVRVGMRWGF